MVWACSQKPATPVLRSQALQLLKAKADTGIELRAEMLRDTVTAGGAAPVEILYALVNGSRPRTIDNEPGRYVVTVTGPDDRYAKSLGGSGPPSGVAPVVPVPLPAGGALLQRQDLHCVNEGAYDAVPAKPSDESCLARYALDMPGRYRVIVEYLAPELGRNASAPEQGQAPTSDASQRAPDLHLADTTFFVVVRR